MVTQFVFALSILRLSRVRGSNFLLWLVSVSSEGLILVPCSPSHGAPQRLADFLSFPCSGLRRDVVFFSAFADCVCFQLLTRLHSSCGGGRSREASLSGFCFQLSCVAWSR